MIKKQEILLKIKNQKEVKMSFLTMDITKNTPKEKVLEIGKECSQCGHCCKFAGGYVLKEELKKLAEFLELSEREFRKKYTDEVEVFNTKILRLKSEVSSKPYAPWIFYDKKEGCMVNEVKPLYCKVGNCNEHGEALNQWFMLNYIVNEADPESIRQWASFLKQNEAIPGGNLEELVPDKNKLNRILQYKILK